MNIAPPEVFATLLLTPAIGAVFSLLMIFVARPMSERALVRVTSLALGASFAGAGGIALHYGLHGAFRVSLGTLGQSPGYEFQLELLFDGLSVALVLMVSSICLLIARFSTTYLHQESGFSRFFTLLLSFAFGALVVVTAGSLELTLFGWELVGWCSVLLIGYYRERAGPVSSAVRALVVYRVSDLALILAAVILHSHHVTKYAPNSGAAALALPPTVITLVALLLVWGSLGKSAQFPFLDWLPRAMEGPTASSALFYGGVSIHLGVYLLLRNIVFVQSSVAARIALITLGAITVAVATITGRARNDAKTQLAYAASTQVGLIYIEIGLGLTTLALLHMLGHASLRTYQLIRAPSLLHHRLEQYAHHFHDLDSLNSTSARGGGEIERRLYALAFFRFGVEGALDSFLVAPILRGANLLDRWDRRGTAVEPRSSRTNE